MSICRPQCEAKRISDTKAYPVVLIGVKTESNMTMNSYGLSKNDRNKTRLRAITKRNENAKHMEH